VSEIFSQASRAVIQIANQEAMRLGHAYIGTEHLLLGIAQEREAIAGQVLRSLGAEPERIRQAVESMLQTDPESASAASQRPPSPRAKTIVGYAIEEARQLYHSSVGAEHLLLGLLRERDCRASAVLENLGLSLDRVRLELVKRLPPGSAAEMARKKALEQRFANHPEVQRLRRRQEELQIQMENAVAAADFDTAVRYRDQRDAVRQELAELYAALDRGSDAGTRPG
jgi:ATP-dependent Clp protease ATP-binding subunit ClpC